jgi:hypothetical protein
MQTLIQAGNWPGRKPTGREGWPWAFQAVVNRQPAMEQEASVAKWLFNINQQ